MRRRLLSAMGRSGLPGGAGLLVALSALLGRPGVAWGLINPKFTPRHLVEQADAFLVLRVKSLDDKGMVHTEVVRAVKGAAPKRAPALDLTTS